MVEGALPQLHRQLVLRVQQELVPSCHDALALVLSNIEKPFVPLLMLCAEPDCGRRFGRGGKGTVGGPVRPMNGLPFCGWETEGLFPSAYVGRGE